ncbi:sporulation protein YqfD [Clostridium sp. SM-530-WT-3G]|uniref:sporulation protein YqfD n=1 Tax=Clostridium sp. SM-530-WT-3G TaxID=2725303 RepID=UPI00145F5CB6|nr:sporulation protein YqfD [Clostridium sp. SM-530-WT-3G]NME82966.1 sporulation protein YqfD [Clostridium sp. SM-530-WT-3G]
MFDKLKKGEIAIEISALNPERILNALWNRNIYTGHVIKLNLTTIRFIIDFSDYKETVDVIKRLKGKFKVVDKSGGILLFILLKRRISLIIGGILFFVVIYVMSNFIWSIQIDTKNNISPFEIRQQLNEIGIKPGLKKTDLNVYEIERKMENLNDQIMWIRTRIEGSTLKLVIEEKINPPSLEENENPNEVVAKMDGEIQRVYTYSGNAAVKPGDIVKKGDTLILGVQGREGFEREVKPKGTVIANTFYEKDMEVQINGDKLTRSGNKKNEMYLNVFGKKIYLKKVLDRYKYYDKIEENNGCFNKTIYFEKKPEKVNEDKDKAVNEASRKLEQSLSKTLSNDSKIIDKKITIDKIDENNIMVRVLFTVQQDIAKGIS